MKKITVAAWPKEKNANKNPYNKILYDAMDDYVAVKEFNKNSFEFKSIDVLHMHWPDHMLRLNNSFKIRLRLWKFFRLIKKLHESGGRLIWTVHNLQPHEVSHFKLASVGLKQIADITDGFIFLSEESKKTFFTLHPEVSSKESIVIPHLHYKDYYDSSNKQVSSRLKSIQLLCFGLLREHKGYKKLFDIARKIKQYDQVGWLIAGNPGKQGISNELEDLWAQNQIIYKACRHINDDEIVPLFAMSDAVILPYEQILNSGTAILALSLGKRVIAPALGSLVDLQQKVGLDWVYLYKQPLDQLKLESAIDWVSQSLPKEPMPNLDVLAPKKVAQETVSFYNSLLQK